MSVPFVSRKRLNPQNLDAEGKFYPAPAYISEIGVNELAEEKKRMQGLRKGKRSDGKRP